MHQNSVWPCKLSFSCWLQGGRHAKGCGANKWLFSCCIGGSGNANTANNIAITAAAVQYGLYQGNNDHPSAGNLVSNTLTDYKRLAASAPSGIGVSSSGVGGSVLPKRVMLKRRNENDVFIKVCEVFNTFDLSVFYRLHFQLECGLPRAAQRTLQKRIIGGRTANFAEYPWQAHIRIAEFQCGGVLVSHNIVATAAHCIQQARLPDISVFLGELDTQNLGHIHEPLPVEKHKVIQKIVHPRFQFRMTQPDRFDVALLKLAKPTGFR